MRIIITHMRDERVQRVWETLTPYIFSVDVCTTVVRLENIVRCAIVKLLNQIYVYVHCQYCTLNVGALLCDVPLTRFNAVPRPAQLAY